MAAVKAKVSKDDLRKLMKERRETLKEQKIESPVAKYNSAGEIFCIICDVQVKSSGFWSSHIASQVHKENVLKKKKGLCNAVKAVNRENESIDKRILKLQPPTVKKLKVDAEVSKSSKSKGTGELPLVDETLKDVQSVDPKNSLLPKDFFEPTASISAASDNASEEKALPEGFFDDPVLDAKARNIEYKDPIEEEWEKYQKAIAEETNVSKTIIAEDLVESVLERDISQIDEQILQWQKIKELESLVEEVKSKVPHKDEKVDLSGYSEDDFDEDELLDWRTKNVAKR